MFIELLCFLEECNIRQLGQGDQRARTIPLNVCAASANARAGLLTSKRVNSIVVSLYAAGRLVFVASRRASRFPRLRHSSISLKTPSAFQSVLSVHITATTSDARNAG